jgi:hypothetical protein
MRWQLYRDSNIRHCSGITVYWILTCYLHLANGSELKSISKQSIFADLCRMWIICQSYKLWTRLKLCAGKISEVYLKGIMMCNLLNYIIALRLQLELVFQDELHYGSGTDSCNTPQQVLEQMFNFSQNSSRGRFAFFLVLNYSYHWATQSLSKYQA